MGICQSEKSRESKKIFDSFNIINQKNTFIFTIANYDENLQKIQESSKNTFEKLGQMQQLRVDFIQEIREEINLINENNYYKNIDYYIEYENQNRNCNYNRRINNFDNYKINEIDKILYDILIMTLTLKSYIKRNYVSNELEKSLLELSIVILKKSYNKNDLKLVLYHLSKMYEILFKNLQNIQSYININEYVTKVDSIASDFNVLTKEEKYPFILTHIKSLGAVFCIDYNNILITNLNQSLLMRYYIYLIIKNNNFIEQNYSSYKKLLTKKYNFNSYEILGQSTYDKKDLIQEDNFSENLVQKAKEYEDLNIISSSLLYFLIICSEDTFKGMNVFYEFDNQLDLGIKTNNLEKELDITKFKESIFMILFSNMNNMNNSSTILLSFFEYFCDNTKFGIQNNDAYYEIFISLYDKFNNKIFIDKYCLLLSKIFIREIENYKKGNLIMDKLYKNIYKLNSSNNNEILDLNNNKIHYEHLYFLINLIKYISLYYIKLKNIKVAYEILIYLTNFLYNIKKVFKKTKKNIIPENIDLQISESFNVTLNNFDYSKNDFYTSLNEIIQIPLSSFLSIYILLINDFFQIKEKNFINKLEKFDNIIIITITYLEVSMIQTNINKYIQMIVKLLNLYINILETREKNDYENISNNLRNNLNLILKETRFDNNLEILCQNIQITSLHIKVIYSAILIILIQINKSNLSDLKSKHNEILNTINKYNNLIEQHCFPIIDNMKFFNIKKIIDFLSSGELYNIQKNTFQHIINIIKKILFNDNDESSENSYNLYRTRTIYQRDKQNEMIINITTNKNDNYQNKPFMFLDNNIKDSFSQFSNNSLNNLNKKSYLNISLNSSHYNVNNSRTFSEKINLPNRDSNNTFNLSQKIENNDIFSDKSDLDFKI